MLYLLDLFGLFGLREAYAYNELNGIDIAIKHFRVFLKNF